MRVIAIAAAAFGLTLLLHSTARGDDDLLFDAVTHPAIAYRTAPVRDPVAELSRAMQAGDARLTFDAAGAGYLRSVLDALHVPVESQMAVFSQTSLQSPLIRPSNPRAIYFTDDVAVAWPRGGFIELAAVDPQQGVQFYTLDQHDTPAPQFVRVETVRTAACLACHVAFATMDVPGLLVKSVAAEPSGRTLPQLANYLTDDRSPLGERWAGWYVTGRTGSARHLGNPDAVRASEDRPSIAAHATTLSSFAGLFDASRYLTPFSDVAALLVFDHQARLVNLLTKTGWDARVATADHRDTAAIIAHDARELVDALLFVDEAPLPQGIESGSGFARAFASRGPVDRNGRSLRQLDLHARLMRYPCSYMIYTAEFDALPAAVHEAVYRRLWDVLSGRDPDRRYARLSAADRRAIVEILRDTKPGLPSYFQ